jgi:hypothetical protein
VSEDESVERLSVGAAAEALGVTRDAIYKRISRGTIRYEKGENGRFYAYVDMSTLRLDSSTDTSTDMSNSESTVEVLRQMIESQERLIANTEDRIAFLERELERRGEETERLHRIVAGLTQATAQLSSRLPELEAHAVKREEVPQSPASPDPIPHQDYSPEPTARETGGGPQSVAGRSQERSWMRRMGKVRRMLGR